MLRAGARMWHVKSLFLFWITLVLGLSAYAAAPVDWERVPFGVEFSAVNPRAKDFSLSQNHVMRAARKFAELTGGRLQIKGEERSERDWVSVHNQLGAWEFHNDHGALEVSAPPLVLQQYREASELDALFAAFKAVRLEPEIGFGGVHGGGGHIHIDSRVFLGRPFLLRNFVVTWRQTLFRQLFQEAFDDQSLGPESWNNSVRWDTQSNRVVFSDDPTLSHEAAMRELDQALLAYGQGKAGQPAIQQVVWGLLGVLVRDAELSAKHFAQLYANQSTPLDTTIQRLRDEQSRELPGSKEWTELQSLLRTLVVSPKVREQEREYFQRSYDDGALLIQHSPNDFRMEGLFKPGGEFGSTLEVRGFSAPTSRGEVTRRVEFLIRQLRSLEMMGQVLVPRTPLSYPVLIKVSPLSQLASQWERELRELGLDPSGYLQDLRRHRQAFFESPELHVEYAAATFSSAVLLIQPKAEVWTKIPRDHQILRAYFSKPGWAVSGELSVERATADSFFVRLPIQHLEDAGAERETFLTLVFSDRLNGNSHQMRLRLGNFVYRGPHAKPMTCVEALMPNRRPRGLGFHTRCYSHLGCSPGLS